MSGKISLNSIGENPNPNMKLHLLNKWPELASFISHLIILYSYENVNIDLSTF